MGRIKYCKELNAEVEPKSTTITVRLTAGDHSFSGFWKTYAAVRTEKSNRSVSKETEHMELWNNTMRHLLGLFIRDFPSLEGVVKRSSEPLVHPLV
jgi:hypothetical protein